MQMLDEQIARFRASALGEFSDHAPWELTRNSTKIVDRLLDRLGDGYALSGNVAIHHTSTIEQGSIIKGPAIIGPSCFVAAGAYIRGGCWLEANCILGPGAELKSSYIFADSKLAHFNFACDSIPGSGVNSSKPSWLQPAGSGNAACASRRR